MEENVVNVANMVISIILIVNVSKSKEIEVNEAKHKKFDQ